MKKALGLGVLLLAVSLAGWAQDDGPFHASKDQQQQSRSLNGSVLDKADNPLPNAVVYLKNTKTLAVKTFFSGPDGSYRFHALSPNVDYEVHAELNGKSSETKTLSSFDTRPDSRINLKIK